MVRLISDFKKWFKFASKSLSENIDYGFIITCILLFAFGFVMIFSASTVTSYTKNDVVTYYLVRQIIIIVLALGITVFTFFMNPKTFDKFAVFSLFVIYVALIGLLFSSKVINGAKSWYQIKGFSFQPSEFFKILIIILSAWYYDTFRNRLEGVRSLVPLFLSAVGIVLIAFQPDYGTAVMCALISGIMYLLAPVKGVYKIRLCIVGALIGIVGFALIYGGSREAQKSRITGWLSGSPCSEERYYSTGNQACNGYIAINNGGIKGRGFGKSIQKHLYLPEPYTDFIICILLEETGLIGGFVLMLLYFILFYRIIRFGLKSTNNRDALICFGGGIYIFINIVVNLAGVFGLLPMTGVPLPFISYGGSFTFCLVIILSIMQRIGYENNIKLKNKMRKQELKK